MEASRRYRNRREAGRRLAGAIARELPEPRDGIVLALPRGGVPVADEVARELELPLDLILVRKLGLPAQPELAMGAIASGGVRVLNREVLSAADVDETTIEAVERQEREELERRERAYRADRPRPEVEGRTVVLVDDGVATGSTLVAAIRAVRLQGADEVVGAVPVSSVEGIRRLREEADLTICPLVPEFLTAIGGWYRDFSQLGDDDVREMLRRAWSRTDARSPTPEDSNAPPG